ncbi:prolyl oligopeptidase family serine peptidase [Gordonia rubripertincta]|uniref:alpha/beta hydrolase n=1 Tax=Gordonia rubripertincta TaxID=36822 RepID=UPI00117DE92C|nr:prolyl oligopeptidase family serine peptidase [Gordonia rubripertincta]TSD93299.1 prolyl oligopeptidase family serine peptidase [Gordonia rubripertincta]
MVQFVVRVSHLIATAAAVALAIGAAGCSAGSEGPSPQSSTATTTTQAPTAAPPVPEPSDGIHVERIDYLDPADADAAENWANLYLPTGDHDDGSVPLVTIIHGGGWESRAGAEQFDEMARDLAARGLAVYNVEYRRVGTGGGWPTTFHDVARALDYVPTMAETHPQLSIDDELVIGHSAGAQLAVWGGTRHRLEDDEVGSRPAFVPSRVVSISGPLDMRYAVNHGNGRVIKQILGGTPEQVPDRYESVDPIQNLDPRLPVILFHGLADDDVNPNNSRRYTAAVHAAGGTADLHLFDGETHTSLVHRQSPAYQQIIDRLTDVATTELDKLRSE